MNIYMYTYTHTHAYIVLETIKTRIYRECCGTAAMKMWGKEQEHNRVIKGRQRGLRGV